jgi:hypothetical protein
MPWNVTCNDAVFDDWHSAADEFHQAVLKFAEQHDVIDTVVGMRSELGGLVPVTELDQLGNGWVIGEPQEITLRTEDGGSTTLRLQEF